jgi:DNA-directed RNA polymerase specialized sigma24 family protein
VADDKKGGMPAALSDATNRDGAFVATRWTMILEAGRSQTPPEQAHSALSELCRIYWRPIFLFLRRQGFNPEDAQDLTQGFFAHLIESRAYARADREKGRFRSFLLGALKHFVAHARAHDRTQKRGGGIFLMPLDTAVIAEADAISSATKQWSPERIYEREWAETLLQQALDRLRKECELAGKDELFAQLNSHLSVRSEAAVPYEELALRLGRPIATLRSDVARLRFRYRSILREEVGGTVAEASEIDAELRHLCEVLAAD